MADENGGPAAVYVSWTTFKNAIEGFAQGVPNRIDRTVFPGLSGGVQAQLLAGLRFLGLIDDDGKPTPQLVELAVPDEATRKEKLKAILKGSYSDLFALNLKKTTPAELGEKMTEAYKVKGDTREKAVRFFLGALDYLDVPVSPLFKKRRAPGTVSRRRNRRQRGAEGNNGGGASEPITSGTSKTLKLRSGGTLTLSATLDLFALDSDDRNFVFGLIDKMESYDRSEGDSDDPDTNGADDDPLQ